MKEVENEFIGKVLNFENEHLEILKLRQLSWRKNPTGKIVEVDAEGDREDDIRDVHYGIYKGVFLVAALRMGIFSQIEKTPYYNRFEDMKDKFTLKPFGALNRLVVHPDYRNEGLGLMVMNGMAEEAKKKGVKTLLAYPSPWSVKLMEQAKYVNVKSLGDCFKPLPGLEILIMKRELI